MNHYVYETTNCINGKKYIGKRSCICDIESDKYMGSGVALNNAFSKYGKDRFTKRVIEVLSTEEDAFEREKYWIKKCNAVRSRDYYNIKDGGEGNTREDAIRNFQKLTEEQLLARSKKLSIANRGKNNSMYGIKGGLSPVARAVVMIDFKGNVVRKHGSISDCNNFFDADTTSSLISRTCLSKKGTAFNHLWLFEEDYNQMKAANNYDKWFAHMKDRFISRSLTYSQSSLEFDTIPVLKLSKDTLDIIQEYPSITIASSSTGISKALIARNCRHGSNTAKGYSWCFKDEYDKLTRAELCKLYTRKQSECIGKPRLSTRKKVMCTTTNQVFNSVFEAVEYFELCKGTKISSVCKGVRKFAGRHPITGEKLVWAYI